MKTSKIELSRFAVCVNNTEYPSSLELYKIYRILSDADAEKEGDLRLIDESGEDYLYPQDYFVMIDVPNETAQALDDAYANPPHPTG